MKPAPVDALPSLPEPGEEPGIVWLAAREYTLAPRHKPRWIIRQAERTVAELVFSAGAYRALVPGRSIAPHSDWRFAVEQI